MLRRAEPPGYEYLGLSPQAFTKLAIAEFARLVYPGRAQLTGILAVTVPLEVTAVSWPELVIDPGATVLAYDQGRRALQRYLHHRDRQQP